MTPEEKFEASYQQALAAAASYGPISKEIELKRLETLRHAGREPQRIKRITSRVGLSRYMINDLVSEPESDVAMIVGEIPRLVPSPYAYSPTHVVYRTKKGGKKVFIVETAHKRYDIFWVPPNLSLLPHRS